MIKKIAVWIIKRSFECVFVPDEIPGDNIKNKKHRHIFKKAYMQAMNDIYNKCELFGIAAKIKTELKRSVRYFVDTENGNDCNSGIAPTQAFKTIEHANNMCRLNAHDKIYVMS